jgi:hypothetical protein
VVGRRKTSSETHEPSVNRAGHSLERNERDARMASRRTHGQSQDAGQVCEHLRIRN